MKSARLLVFWGLFLPVLGLVSAVASGCGRSSLDDFLTSGIDGSITPTDGATDAGDGSVTPVCSTSTCPTGCCDANGMCQLGISDDACGTLGASCTSCIGQGLDFCDGTTHTCAVSTGGCSASNCAGCCGGQDGGTCLTGAADTACGTGGSGCIDCTASGASCDPAAQACGQMQACGPATCNGCCVGNVCVGGSDDQTCGTAGQECVDCTSTGQTCGAMSGDAGGTGGACTGTASCGPSNCTGCCVGNVCLPGKDNSACGTAGGTCESCAFVGDVCAASSTGAGGFCQTACGPDNCTGCCEGNTCVTDTTAAECGVAGAACVVCGAKQTCLNGTCNGTTTCDATNCTGCCVGDVCAVGTQDVHCGEGGARCVDCTGQGDVCSNGACAAPPCGPTNCAGCCQNNTCVTGTADATCGTGGQSCQNCDALTEVCKAGACAQPPPPCDATTCASGCCDPNTGCQAGFVDTACGSGAATCTDCTGMGSTCDTSVSPRVCVDQQTTCPATFATCAGTTPTAAPTPSAVCSATELSNAAAACKDGANSTACQQYFAFEATQNASCNSCLTTFRYDFSAKNGVYTCIAPYVTATCDDSTFCETSCEATSCSQCSSDGQSSCLATVRAGQCSTYLTASEKCTQTALNSKTGAFCNPSTYANVFGSWLQAVGQAYCGSSK